MLQRAGLALLILSALVAATSANGMTRPKPWQWTESKAAAKLTAIGPTTFDAGEIGNTVYRNVCRGLGRGVLSTKDGRHYSRFACTFRVGSTNGSMRDQPGSSPWELFSVPTFLWG